MGIFTRPRSPYWWLYLETIRRKEKTQIVIGTTTTERRDSRRLAQERYYQRMNELAARLYRLPSAQPAIRFAKYAETYGRDVIPHHRGADREQQLLTPLRAFFDEDLLTAIDQDRVRAYFTQRKATAGARTMNREVDLLKSMLRDAAPKYLAESPLKGMKRLRVVPPKRRLMTAREELRLLAVGDATDRALLLLGVDGLVRLGDLLDLRRSDRRGRWLYIADPKSGEPYEVFLTYRAGYALDRVPDYGTPYYFAKFRRAENPRDWPGSVRQRFETLCRKARIPYGRATGLTFHWATRRTGATRLIVDRRASIPAVQRQGNWKKPNTLLAIYTEADRKAQQQAISLPQRAHQRRKRA
jgi:integrase